VAVGLAVIGVTTAVSLGVWGVVRRRWGLFSDMLDPGQWSPDIVGQLPRRLGVIARGYVEQAMGVGPRYPGWGLLWPLAAAGMWLSARERLRETAPFWILVAVHFAGATAAYLVTGANPALHLSRSVDRLWLHVAPAALLATLMAFEARRSVPSPGEARAVTGE
jgi:hypothetical protein